MAELLSMLCSSTSGKIHDGTAGKVMEAVDAEPSLRVPCPMRNNGVDESSDHNAVYNVSDKVAPFS